MIVYFVRTYDQYVARMRALGGVSVPFNNVNNVALPLLDEARYDKIPAVGLLFY